MSTLVMTRTVCCEAYKQFGRRCGICPHRPENRQAVANYLQESSSGLGCISVHEVPTGIAVCGQFRTVPEAS